MTLKEFREKFIDNNGSFIETNLGGYIQFDRIVNKAGGHESYMKFDTINGKAYKAVSTIIYKEI